MQKINFKSDLKIVESYPNTDDFVYHYTTDEKVCYDVSLEIGNCRKAEPECGCGNAKLIICLDNHGLNIGQLKVRRELRYKDDDMPDGIYNKITENNYDIFLVKGASTEVDEIEVDGYLPIFRGEKGDAYEITEDDYEEIAELAATKIDLSNYYTKGEADAKFQDKLNLYTEDESNVLIETNNDEGLQSSIQVSPNRINIAHTGPIEQLNGNIEINNDGISLSHKGRTDNDDTNVFIADGKIYVNDKEVAISGMEEVKWKEFYKNISYPKVGWTRVVRENSPGQTSGYNGFAYTQFFEGQTTQILFVDNSTNILYRNFKPTFEEPFDTSWKELVKEYKGSTGISVSDNGTITLIQKFKSVNGESVEGEGDIAVQTPLNYYSEGENYVGITVNSSSVDLSDNSVSITSKKASLNLLEDGEITLSSNSENNIQLKNYNNTLVLGKYDFTLNGKEIAVKDDLEAKQDTLVSGTNIKTINGESVLGSGDIVETDPIWTAEKVNYYTKDDIDSKLGDLEIILKSI